MAMFPPRHTQTGFLAPFLLGIAGSALAIALLWAAMAPPPAFGQVPDSGAQRLEMIKQLKSANQKLDKIASILSDIRDGKTASDPRKADPKGKTDQP